jgi:hypothetical protein
MTGEEMERAIEFILNQQAKFESTQQQFQETLIIFKEQAEKDRQEMREAVGEIKEAVGEIKEAIVVLNTSIVKIVDFTESLADSMRTIIKDQGEIRRRVKALEENDQ